MNGKNLPKRGWRLKTENNGMGSDSKERKGRTPNIESIEGGTMEHDHFAQMDAPTKNQYEYGYVG